MASPLVTITNVPGGVDVHIEGHGYYRSHGDLFAARLEQPRAFLLAEVLERCADEPGDRTMFRSFSKRALAAMLADFDTGSRVNAIGEARIAAARAEARLNDEHAKGAHDAPVGRDWDTWDGAIGCPQCAETVDSAGVQAARQALALDAALDDFGSAVRTPGLDGTYATAGEQYLAAGTVDELEDALDRIATGTRCGYIAAGHPCEHAACPDDTDRLARRVEEALERSSADEAAIGAALTAILDGRAPDRTFAQIGRAGAERAASAQEADANGTRYDPVVA